MTRASSVAALFVAALLGACDLVVPAAAEPPATSPPSDGADARPPVTTTWALDSDSGLSLCGDLGQIVEAPDGALWTTGQGIERWMPEPSGRLARTGTISDVTPSLIAASAAGDAVWIATDDNTLARLHADGTSEPFAPDIGGADIDTLAARSADDVALYTFDFAASHDDLDLFDAERGLRPVSFPGKGGHGVMVDTIAPVTGGYLVQAAVIDAPEQGGAMQLWHIDVTTATATPLDVDRAAIDATEPMSFVSDGASLVWALSQPLVWQAGKGGVWRSADAGAHWSAVTLPAGVVPTAIALRDGAAILGARAPSSIWIEHTAGAPWTTDDVDALDGVDVDGEPLTSLVWKHDGTVALSAWCTILAHRRSPLP